MISALIKKMNFYNSTDHLVFIGASDRGLRTFLH